MSRNPILDLASAPALANTLFTATRLGVFDLLAGGGMSVEQLAEQTPAKSPIFAALLDACVAMGLLRVRDGIYTNSHLSEVHLVKGRPLYLGDYLHVQAIESAGWQRLHDVITQGGAAAQYGVDTQVETDRFTMAMNNLAMLGEAEALASAVDLSECKTMVDVGCGSGMYSVALCRHYRELHSTLLDRDEVLATARRIVEDSELQGRISTRSVDITKHPYGENLDVVLLSDVLYQDEDTCLTLLKSAHRALRSGGMLVVRGYFSDPEGAQPLFGAIFALAMQLSGPNRAVVTVSAVRGWAEQAGFKRINSFALSERSTCLTAIK
jgi:ubiquinone/menaquinone biosynthesis C-methylase UbiE